MTMSVIVSMLDSSTCVTDIDFDYRVLDLKERLSEEYNLDVEFIELFYAGDVLINNILIRDYGITNDSELQLDLTSRGHAIKRLGGKEKVTQSNFISVIREGLAGDVSDYITAGISINEKTNGATPLHIAVRSGCFDVVKIICGTPSVQIDNPSIGNCTPIEFATALSKEIIVKYLISLGACTDKVMFIAAVVDLSPIVKILIENGADFNKKDSVGSTPLSIAAECGSMKVIKLLLEAKADLDICNNLTQTAIHRVCETCI